MVILFNCDFFKKLNQDVFSDLINILRTLNGISKKHTITIIVITDVFYSRQLKILLPNMSIKGPFTGIPL